MSVQVPLPSSEFGTVVPDPYRVIAVVDAFGQQAELDESNNITVSEPRAAGTATTSAR